MDRGGIADIVFALAILVGLATLFRLWWVNQRDRRLLQERLEHQRALSALDYGDMPQIPTIEQPRGE